MIMGQILAIIIHLVDISQGKQRMLNLKLQSQARVSGLVSL